MAKIEVTVQFDERIFAWESYEELMFILTELVANSITDNPTWKERNDKDFKSAHFFITNVKCVNPVLAP